ncbi:signal transducer and activator of transcription B [Culex quinquefasciatus]|uniref:signal transducer and activator of transcription B n=1 Tax=Culex quinquefasciatus TaxID=7176 RepID=UPI0018E2B03A|nr:signal transducer and activator of transcription B [Culex quinquefasciatus]
MTLPTNPGNAGLAGEDESDMFGPPHTSPPVRRNRPKVPMISAQLRMREVRKRILQLCVHKLERIKDSERNLRRSVCINNTYSRLTDDIRREKQHKYLMLNQLTKSDKADNVNNNNIDTSNKNSNNENLNNSNYQHHRADELRSSNNNNNNDASSINNNTRSAEERKSPKKSSASVETDLETLDRELCALDAAMPLVDPEITQGAEQLEQAMMSRKRKFSQKDDDDNNDRLVREALSQFYLPSNRLLSGIDDCPTHHLLSGPLDAKRTKVDLLEHKYQHHHHHPFHSLPDLNVALELTNQSHQKDFEVIMDALRIGAAAAAAGSSMVSAGATGCGSTTGNIDSCGQAAMMMAGEAGSVFHNLVVTSLET